MGKNLFAPIDNTSVVQQVIDRITTAMIRRELRPGDKLPTELELASIFGIGRNSVREAIKILVSFGVLEIRRPEGTFVTQGFSDKMLDPLLYGIILDQTDSIESLKELREWMDLGILRLAIEKATAEDIELLRKRFEVLRDTLHENDVESIFRADNDFHAAIAEAGHNTLFARIADLVRLLTSDMRLRTVQNMIDMGKHDDMERVHEALVKIVEKKDRNFSQQVISDGYFYMYDVLQK